MAKESGKYLLAFDTETGGLDPKESDILTAYFAIVDEEFKVVEELDLKLKPDDRFPIATEGALRVNKIDIHRHLEDPSTITYSEGKEAILGLIKKYHKKRGRYSNIRPFGQNIQFDIDFIQQHLISKKEWDSLIHYSKVDTKTVTDFLKDCGWFPQDLGTLGSVVSFLGLPSRSAHNAKEDVLMTIDVYKKILDIMASKKENSIQQDLIALLEDE